MDNKTLKLACQPGLSIPMVDAEKLITAADSDCALLYIYILSLREPFSSEKASKDLNRSVHKVSETLDKLSYMGLIEFVAPKEPEKKLRPAQELPEYSAKEVTTGSASDGDFQAVVEETQRILGRVLSTPDLKILYGIYDYLGMPPEVMLVLINHCVEEFQESFGQGRLPTLRRIEKEAFNWADNNITSLDLAEEHIRLRKKRRSDTEKVKDILQIRGRELSSTESKYVESWLSMGFEFDVIDLAYDKTVMRTGGLQWRYMNTILESWHSKELLTVAQIEQGDGMAPGKAEYRRKSTQSSPPLSPAEHRGDLDRMKKILEQMNNA